MARVGITTVICALLYGEGELESLEDEGRGRESKGKEGENEEGRGRESKGRTGEGEEGRMSIIQSSFLSEHTNLWTPTVAGFISLSDPITTDRVPYGHGGYVGEAATEVEGGQPSVEVSSATTAPLGGGRGPRDGGHDAGTRGI